MKNNNIFKFINFVKEENFNIKYLASFLCLAFLIGIIFVVFINNRKTEDDSKKEIVSAFLRVKNEIRTIKACLESIDGIFDKIVIIHSNEPDDGSVDFMNKWCAQRDYCEIHEYPHRVIPSHSEEYRNANYSYENSLAAYYNWGLQFFTPEEWVVKIDGDQVYIKERLRKYIELFKNKKRNEKMLYGMIGYNSFVRKNELVVLKSQPISGGSDGFIIKRKNINSFEQQELWERIDIDIPVCRDYSSPVWFHFMKSIKSGENIQDNDNTSDEQIQYLTRFQKKLFERNIRPLLEESPYYDVSIPTMSYINQFKELFRHYKLN